MPNVQDDDIESQLPHGYLVQLVGHLVLGVTSLCEYNPLGVRRERSEIKLTPWILAQFVLHSVPSVGQRVLIRVLALSVLYHLAIDISTCLAGKLVHGLGNSFLLRNKSECNVGSIAYEADSCKMAFL